MSNNLAVDYLEENRGFTTPCWIWQGVANNKGYGLVRRNNQRLQLAHVHLFEKFGYIVPRGLELDHLCKVPLCCNPHHMEPVTHTENMRRGAHCTTTLAEAREIRQKYAAAPRKYGMHVSLAKEHGLGIHTIRQIIYGTIWREDA